MQELTMSLDPQAKTPLYEQIYNYIKNDIQSGQIKAREKLPSSRSLASYLGISRSTVDLAYAQLVSEGYLISYPCKGYYACQIEGLLQWEPERDRKQLSEQKKADAFLFDFTPNGIDLESFPYSVWRKLSRDRLLDDRMELFQQGDPKGEWELRKTIASYLHQARGVNCMPEQIVLGAGNDYLLLLLSALLGSRHKLAMENPTYLHAYKILEQLGFTLCTIPVDGQGMKTEDLRASGADIAYVMPSHQYPLGVVMPIGRRVELLKWAEEAEGRYLIEDDYDSEFRYKGKPIPALQGSDHKGKVIYLGTFSRSIAPGIRISYLVLPPQLLEVCEKKLGLFSSTVSRLDQMILNDFIKEGCYERHLNRMRTIYGRKRELLLGELKSLSGVCRITGECAGVHLLLTFENQMSEEEAVLRAAEQGVKVYPLSAYCAEKDTADGRKDPTVLLGYAVLREKEIPEAVERLKLAWCK